MSKGLIQFPIRFPTPQKVQAIQNSALRVAVSIAVRVNIDRLSASWWKNCRLLELWQHYRMKGHKGGPHLGSHYAERADIFFSSLVQWHLVALTYRIIFCFIKLRFVFDEMSIYLWIILSHLEITRNGVKHTHQRNVQKKFNFSTSYNFFLYSYIFFLNSHVYRRKTCVLPKIKHSLLKNVCVYFYCCSMLKCDRRLLKLDWTVNIK